jgi:hypothetical protein
LCAAARPWKPISRSSRRTVLVLMLLPGATELTLDWASFSRVEIWRTDLLERFHSMPH